MIVVPCAFDVRSARASALAVQDDFDAAVRVAPFRRGVGRDRVGARRVLRSESRPGRRWLRAMMAPAAAARAAESWKLDGKPHGADRLVVGVADRPGPARLRLQRGTDPGQQRHRRLRHHGAAGAEHPGLPRPHDGRVCGAQHRDQAGVDLRLAGRLAAGPARRGSAGGICTGCTGPGRAIAGICSRRQLRRRGRTARPTPRSDPRQNQTNRPPTIASPAAPATQSGTRSRSGRYGRVHTPPGRRQIGIGAWPHARRWPRKAPRAGYRSRPGRAATGDSGP